MRGNKGIHMKKELHTLHKAADTPRQRTSAFTLIEMLVVIAIIGLLASLLVPATQKAVERSKAIKTLSNMRGAGTMMLSYAAENNGHFPWVEDRTTGNYSTQSWRHQLLKFAGGIRSNYRVLDAPSCPFRPNILVFGATANCAFSMNKFMGESNSQGDVIYGKPTSNGYVRPDLSDFVRPTTTMVIASGVKAGEWNNNAYTQTSLWYPTVWARGKKPNAYLPLQYQKDAVGGMGYWFDDGVAMLMVDGHVERVPRGHVTWGHLYPFAD